MYVDSIESANRKIAARTSYGVREVLATDDCYQISWSNSSASWYLSSNQILKGKKVRCDANQVLISMRKRDIMVAIEAKQLQPLPLYENSYERVWGGAPKP